MGFLASLLLALSLSSLLLSPAASIAAPAVPGIIQRTTKQQILASIPPNSEENSVPFLTSPAGKYTALLLRRETAPGAGGLGNDFCYIQVQDTATGRSMWESVCGPVSTENTCAVVFTENGLQVFDGSTPVWDSGAQSADNNFLATVELVDQGDMRIRDKDGELAWKASQDARANQNCGLPGSPGLAPALPPFAVPVGGYDPNLAFGQAGAAGAPAGGVNGLPQANTAYNQHPVGGASQAFGFHSEPLVDNTPFDSGSFRGDAGWWTRIGVVAVFVAVLA